MTLPIAQREDPVTVARTRILAEHHPEPPGGTGVLTVRARQDTAERPG
ncbi:hypothetical protein [Streptomyces sp. DH37]|nr:hypothetical protein [Streptomyces sp. DH37]MDG9703949.1 hypothetical protein [Streptomyces sp. DH37]